MKLFSGTTELGANGDIVTSVSNAFATFCKNLYNGTLNKSEVMEQLEEDPIIGEDYNGYVFETGWVTPSNDLNATRQILFDVAPLSLNSYDAQSTMILQIQYGSPQYSQDIQKKLIKGEWIFCEIQDTGLVKYISDPDDTTKPMMAIRLSMPITYCIGTTGYGVITGHNYLVNAGTANNASYEIELLLADPMFTITDNVPMLGRFNSRQKVLFNTMSIPGDQGSYAEIARREAVIAVTRNFVSR